MSKARSASPSCRSTGSQRATNGRIASTRLAEDAPDLRVDDAQAEVLGGADAQRRQVDRRQRPERAPRRPGTTADRAHRSRRSPRACSAVSSTLRPIGPSTEMTDQPSGRRRSATSPGDGRSPTTPHSAAGMRSEPPVSEPVAQRQHVDRQRRRRAARRAAGIERRIEGVAGRAPHRVARVGAGAHVGHVGLGGDDRAGRAQPGDERVVARRHVAAQAHVAVGGEQPGGVLQVLHAERQAVQRAERRAAHHLRLGRRARRRVRARSRWRRSR